MFLDREREHTPWSLKENKQLTQLYNTELLDIIKISKILKRTPDKIIQQLKHLKCISCMGIARGHLEYLSDKSKYTSLIKIYRVACRENARKDIVDNDDADDIKEIHQMIHMIIEKYQSMDDVLPYIENDDLEKNSILQKEVNDLKKEVNILKQEMKELREIIGV